MSKYQVGSEESCPFCGSELIIHTDAEQDSGNWIAGVDDEALCHECGFIGYVDVDEDDGTGWISYDEESEHNECVWQKLKSEGLVE